MKIVIKDFKRYTMEEISVGLFMPEHSTELCFKSEYRTNGKFECYIVSSGEFYCGPEERLLRVELQDEN